MAKPPKQPKRTVTPPHQGELGMDTRTVVQRDTSSLPPNRLI